MCENSAASTRSGRLPKPNHVTTRICGQSGSRSQRESQLEARPVKKLHLRGADILLERLDRLGGGWVKTEKIGKVVTRSYFIGNTGNEEIPIKKSQAAALIRLGKISVAGNRINAVMALNKADFIVPAKKRLRECMKCRKKVWLPQGLYRCDKCHSTESSLGIRTMRVPNT